MRRVWHKMPEERDTSTEDPGATFIMELGVLSEALGALATAADGSAGVAEEAGRMLRRAVVTLFAGTEQSAQPEAFVSQFGVGCVAPAESVIYGLSRQLPRGEAAAALQRTAEAITTALERFLQPSTDAARGASWPTSGWRARVCHWAVDLLGTVMRALRGDAASVRALFDRLIDRVPWAEAVAVPLQDVFTACHEVLLAQEVAEPTVGSVDARLAAKLLADCAHWPGAVEFPGLVRAIAASLRAVMEQAPTVAIGAIELNASRQVWSAALRRLFAVAPDDALPDMWCVLEMETAATPALASALLTSMHRDEAQSTLRLCEHSGTQRRRLSAVDLALCMACSAMDVAQVAAAATEHAATLLWAQYTASDAPASALASLIGEAVRMPGMERAAASVAELGFAWMVAGDVEPPRRLPSTPSVRADAPNGNVNVQPVRIRRRGRKRRHRDGSGRHALLQHCGVLLLEQLLVQHRDARQEVLCACLTAMADPSLPLPARAACCAVIERVALSRTHRLLLQEFTVKLVEWVQALAVDIPLALTKRLLAALAPLAVLWPPLGDALMLYLRKLTASRAVRARRLGAHGLACLLSAPYIAAATEDEVVRAYLRALDTAPGPVRAEALLALAAALRCRSLRAPALMQLKGGLADMLAQLTTANEAHPSPHHLDLSRCFADGGVQVEAVAELMRCAAAMPLSADVGGPSQAPSTAVASADVSGHFLYGLLTTLVDDLADSRASLRLMGLDLLLQRPPPHAGLPPLVERVQIARTRCELAAKLYETVLDTGCGSMATERLLQQYGCLTQLIDTLLPSLVHSAMRSGRDAFAHVTGGQMCRDDHGSQRGGAVSTAEVAEARTLRTRRGNGAEHPTAEHHHRPCHLFSWVPASCSAAEVAADLAYAASAADSEQHGFAHDRLEWIAATPALSVPRALQLLSGCAQPRCAVALVRCLHQHLDMDAYFREQRLQREPGRDADAPGGNGTPAWADRAALLLLLQLLELPPAVDGVAPTNTAAAMPDGDNLLLAVSALELECSPTIRESFVSSASAAAAQSVFQIRALEFLQALLARWRAGQARRAMHGPSAQPLGARAMAIAAEPASPDAAAAAASHGGDIPGAPQCEMPLALLLAHRFHDRFQHGLSVRQAALYGNLLAQLLRLHQAAAEPCAESAAHAQCRRGITRHLRAILSEFHIEQPAVVRHVLQPLLLAADADTAVPLAIQTVRQCAAAAGEATSDAVVDSWRWPESELCRAAAVSAALSFAVERAPRVRSGAAARTPLPTAAEMQAAADLAAVLRALFSVRQLVITATAAAIALNAAQHLSNFQQRVCRVLRRHVGDRTLRAPRSPLAPGDGEAAPSWQCRTAIGDIGRVLAEVAAVDTQLRPVQAALCTDTPVAQTIGQSGMTFRDIHPPLTARTRYRLEQYEVEGGRLAETARRVLAHRALKTQPQLQQALSQWTTHWQARSMERNGKSEAAGVAQSVRIVGRVPVAPAMDTKPGKGSHTGYRRATLRSRNRYIDQMLRVEGGADAYADLEDFIDDDGDGEKVAEMDVMSAPETEA